MSANNCLPALQSLQRSESTDQYLTFIIENEEYGIDITSIMEIRRWKEPTKLPNVPTFIKGVLNLRGSIIPVISLRQKFDLPMSDEEKKSVVIVLQCNKVHDIKIMGIMVDSVSDVYSINKDSIQTSNTLTDLTLSEHVKGMFDTNDRIITILDINSILTIDEKQTLEI